MELFSAQWLSALLAIILIDLVLAGDNAVAVGLAAGPLPLGLGLPANACRWRFLLRFPFGSLFRGGSCRRRPRPHRSS